MFDSLTDESQITARSLFDSFVTLLYEVAKEDESFEWRYDGATFALTTGE